MTVWSHHMDVPFAQIQVTVPIGTVHSNNKNEGGVYGIAHFLEHMCGERSRLFPEKHSFEQNISACGGNWNAWTTAFTTTYYMQAPKEDFENLLPGFVSHIYNPIFLESDIKLQRSIIRNERFQQKYYPADDELHLYKFTQWMKAYLFSKKQVFGSDADLESISPEKLNKFHSNYFSRNTVIVVGGTYNTLFLENIFSEIKTHNTSLIEEYEPYAWTNKSYHTMETTDTDVPVYSIGNLSPKSTLDDILSIGFICELLTNQQYGVLNTWIRKEQGWTYGVTSTFWYSNNQLGWIVDIPMNDIEVVEIIRHELHTRITQALTDEMCIHFQKNRALKTTCFEFQTLNERIHQASEPILIYGINFTEQMYIDWLETNANTDYLMHMYTKHFSPAVCGELLELPKSEIEGAPQISL